MLYCELHEHWVQNEDTCTDFEMDNMVAKNDVRTCKQCYNRERPWIKSIIR